LTVNVTVPHSEIGRSEIVSSQSILLAREAETTRRRWLAGLIASIAIIGSCAFYLVIESGYVTSVEAYVDVNVVSVASSIDGDVKEVRVSDGDFVKEGSVLVVLGDDDARLAVAQAEANLARAEERKRSDLAAENRAMHEPRSIANTIPPGQIDLASAKLAFKRAGLELERCKALAFSGCSAEELAAAEAWFVQTRSALDAARSSQEPDGDSRPPTSTMHANEAIADGTAGLTLARAQLDQARADLERAVIRAPIEGVVAQPDIHVGQHLQSGTQLISMVPVKGLHVDAYFKDVQLKKIREGQEVELFTGLYGKDVVYRGRVVGFCSETGASLILTRLQGDAITPNNFRGRPYCARLARGRASPAPRGTTDASHHRHSKTPY
jgi:membrane fusion protein (multidrug efflux system)